MLPLLLLASGHHHEHRQQKEAAHRSRHLGGIAARRVGEPAGAICAAATCWCGWRCAASRRCCCGRSRAAGRRPCPIIGATCRSAISWPARNSSARIPKRREKARESARRLAIATYDQDPAQLEQLRAKLENDVTEIVAAKSLADVDKLWDTFRLPLAEGTPQADRGRARAAVSEVSRCAGGRRRAGEVQDRAQRGVCAARSRRA